MCVGGGKRFWIEERKFFNVHLGPEKKGFDTLIKIYKQTYERDFYLNTVYMLL
jgi:hypothetical protein